MASKAISVEAYRRFQQFLEQNAGIVLGENKQYLVDSRLAPILAEEKIATLEELLSRIEGFGAKGLRERVIDAMTTNETLWFRDRKPFQLLEQIILPKFTGRSLRIWSAACSSGQEPYSIVFTIETYRERHPASAPGRVEIVATDLSPTMLKMAKAAEYDALSVARGLSEEHKARFFDRKGEHWVVKPEYRRMVSFRQLNLQESFASLGHFDVIFCRNVLIYFSEESKRDILNRLARALNPEGYLILGSSESTSGYSDSFKTERYPQGALFRPLSPASSVQPGGAASSIERSSVLSDF